MSGVAYITLYIIYVAKCDDRLWLYYNVSICCTFRCVHPPTRGQPAANVGAFIIKQMQSSGERGEASIMFDQRYFEEVRHHSAVVRLCCRVRVTTTPERGINRACVGE